MAAVVLLSGSIALYGAGAASNQAWAWATVSDTDGVSLASPTLVVFSFASLVRDNWSAGSYFNAIALAVFGLAFPIIRNMLMLWFLFLDISGTAPSVLLVEIAQKMGGFVNTDGAIAKMAFTLVIPLYSLLTLSVVLYPAAGFYLFMAAHISGLVGGQVALWGLRRNLSLDISASSFSHKKSLTRALGMSEGWRIVSFLMIVIGTGATTAGLVLPCVHFKMGGAARELLLMLPNSPAAAVVDRDLSVLDLMSHLIDGIPTNWGLAGAYAGETVLGLVGVAFVLLSPIACALALFLPPSRKLLFAVEWSRVWSGLEVWVLVLAASYLSIELLGEFIIGPNCSLINEILLAIPSLFPSSGGICFTMHAVPRAGLYLLLTGAIMLFGVSALIVSSMLHVLEGREPAPWWIRWARQKNIIKSGSNVSYEKLATYGGGASESESENYQRHY